jgi:hypothetical protein
MLIRTMMTKRVLNGGTMARHTGPSCLTMITLLQTSSPVQIGQDALLIGTYALIQTLAAPVMYLSTLHSRTHDVETAVSTTLCGIGTLYLRLSQSSRLSYAQVAISDYQLYFPHSIVSIDHRRSVLQSLISLHIYHSLQNGTIRTSRLLRCLPLDSGQLRTV